MPSPAPYTISNYRLLSHIGEGNAGTVYKAEQTIPSQQTSHKTHPNAQTFAVKIIPCNKVTQTTRREVAIHYGLNHPNIIPLHRVATAKSPHTGRTHLALLLEYAPGGDMFNEVVSAGCLQPRTLRRRLTNIATALDYLHKNRVVHLDVKLENVVVSNSAAAKLLDFGCARRLDAPHEAADTTLGGTLHYLPPERIADPDVAPSEAMDAWALGVLVYTALAGNYPFNAVTAQRSCDNDDEDDEDKRTRRRILHERPHPIPASVQVPSDLQRIITGLLEKDASKRMTIPQVLETLQQTATTSVAFRRSRYAHLMSQSRQEKPPASQVARTPSPAGPADADFGLCPKACRSCDTCRKQGRLAALSVVDRVRRMAAEVPPIAF